MLAMFPKVKRAKLSILQHKQAKELCISQPHLNWEINEVQRKYFLVFIKQVIKASLCVCWQQHLLNEDSNLLQTSP